MLELSPGLWEVAIRGSIVGRVNLSLETDWPVRSQIDSPN